MGVRGHRAGGWLEPSARLMLMLLVCVACGGASAAVPDLVCSPAGGEAVEIAAVDADFHLVLRDGRTVLLAGVDPVRATPSRLGAAEDARAHLAAWLVGRPARLRPLDTGVDRWGRTRALVFASTGTRDLDKPVAPDPALLSVGLALVDAGLARGRADAAMHACWPTTIVAEAGARAAGLGLWSDPYYAVRAAGNPSALTDLSGSFVLVQGQVTRVAKGRSRTLVDLGPRGADVSLRIAGNASFILGQVGLSEDRLLGRNVRVRGVLDDRFGYTIDVSDRDQIEVLADPLPGRPETVPDGPR